MICLSESEAKLVSGGTSTYEVMAASAIVGIFLGVIKSDPTWWGLSMITGLMISGALIVDDHMGFQPKMVRSDTTELLDVFK